MGTGNFRFGRYFVIVSCTAYASNSDIILQLQKDGKPKPKEMEVKFQLGNDTLQEMIKSMYSIKDQLPNVVSFCPCSLSCMCSI